MDRRPGGAKPTICLEDARAILGEDFIGIEEAQEYFGIALTEKHRTHFRRVPFSGNVLEQCKGTHLLIAGFPFSILEIRVQAPQGLFHTNGEAWYNHAAFARREKVRLRWYLMRKDVIPGSLGRPFAEQLALLGQDEEVPRACEVVYQVILSHLARGTRPFENVHTRCRDLISEGVRVDVGGFRPESGLEISLWDEKADDDIGLSASWRI